jgi:L-fuculose-phosphate aldolase
MPSPSLVRLLASREAKTLVEMGERLHARNLLAGCDGNLSCRLASGHILITPTQLSKIFLRPANLVILSPEGIPLQGTPSSEVRLHLQVYSRSPEARAVFHAHPPAAVAWTLTHPTATELPGNLLPESILACGTIPVAPYARPGTPELAASIAPFLPSHRVILLARHGALCWGHSPEEAFYGMERVEHIATILRYAAAFGDAPPLSEEEVAALWECRKWIGEKTL